MKLLKLNRELFIWLNFYPTDRFNGRMKYLPIATGFLIVFLAISGSITSGLLIRPFFVEGQVIQCLEVLFQCEGMISVVYAWIVAYVIQSKLINIFTKLQSIYDTSKIGFNIQNIYFVPKFFMLCVLFLSLGEDPILIRYLDKADRKCHVITKFLVVYSIPIYWSTLVTLAVANLIYCYLVYGRINEDALYKPFLDA